MKRVCPTDVQTAAIINQKKTGTKDVDVCWRFPVSISLSVLIATEI